MRPGWRRAVKVAAWVAGGLVALPVVLVAAMFALLNTDPGRRLAQQAMNRFAVDTISVAGLRGRFPDRLRLGHAEVRDAQGAWLVLDDVALNWSPLRLIHGEASVQSLTAGHVQVPRLPVPSSASSSGGGFNLPVSVDLQRLDIARADIGAAVAGSAASVSIEGSARLASLQDGEARATIRQIDSAGVYSLDGRIDPLHLQAHVQAEEPAHGLLAGLAKLPALGPLSITASLDGPRSAEATAVALSAGPLQAKAAGSIDLEHQAADLTVTATAPAMQPRDDLAWQSVALDAHVHGAFARPDASATLLVDGLAAAGATVRTLTLDAAGNAGRIGMHAALAGLRIPGPRPDLLEAAPLTLQADAQLDAPDRPVHFAVDHPLLAVRGEAQTAGEMAAHATLTLPALAPFAQLANVALDGHAALTAHAALHGSVTDVTLDGTTSVTAGLAPVPGLIGEDAKLSAAANIQGGTITVSHASLDGRALHAGAHGTDRNGVLDLAWEVALSDLSVLSQAVQGAVSAAGRVQGSPASLAVDADASGDVGTTQIARGPVSVSLHAAGLPGAPSGRITARGTLDGAPLDVVAAVQRDADGTMHAQLDRAAWKTAQAEGAVTLAPGATWPQGKLTLRMPKLDELRPLLGQPVRGSLIVEADLPAGQPAHVTIEARDAGLGTSAVGRLSLDARVTDPTMAPSVSARLDASGIAAGGVAGRARLTAEGRADALALRLDTGLTLMGADAAITGTALLDTTGNTLRVSALQAGWKGETLRLLAPVRIAFADGVALDRLRLGLDAATLEAAGRVSPTLDLTASLAHVTPALLRPFAPSLDADGIVSAEARLTGTPARPQGSVHLAATGMRLRSGPGRALPAASMTATATLAGTAARIEAQLAAGSAVQLALAGTAPLDATGALDLHARGALDLTVLDPILAADGRRVRGRASLDASATGTLAAPRLGGSLQLAGGEVQDFAQGVHLTKLAATILAEGDSLRIASLTAAAGPGTIGASGRIGVLAPGLPVDLHITMHHARPLASDLLSAQMDADVTVQGAVQTGLAVGGRVTVQRADITVPDRLPASVAVLNVRRAGTSPPPPAQPTVPIVLNLTVSAPAQVFVRGHGLDAELGGTLTLGGTSAAPQLGGGFDLRRGTFALIGQTVTFTRGRVGFDGTGVTGRIDPTLDFQADVVRGSITATLLVGGYASAPKISLSSTPDLPQDEILAQLLFGQSAKDLGPFQIAEIAAGLASLSGVGGAGTDPLGRVRNTLGLDRLSVGSAGTTGNGASIQAGRYVAPGVYVGAKQGTSGSGTQLQVQVDLYKGLKLETDLGTGSNSAAGADSSSGSNVGLTYQFEY